MSVPGVNIITLITHRLVTHNLTTNTHPTITPETLLTCSVENYPVDGSNIEANATDIPLIIRKLSQSSHTLVAQSSSGPYKTPGTSENIIGYYITSYTFAKKLS